MKDEPEKTKEHRYFEPHTGAEMLECADCGQLLRHDLEGHPFWDSGSCPGRGGGHERD